jgi:hypothetical protein
VNQAGPRAVVVPHPPLLAGALTGPGAEPARPLRAACVAAVQGLLAAEHPELVVVGPGTVTLRHSELAWGTLAGFGVAVDAPVRRVPLDRSDGDRRPELPLSLTVGCHLVDQVRAADRTVRLHPVEVAAAGDAEACRRLGATLAAEHPDAGWLVVGDGTTRRTDRAPGAFDARAERYDAAVEAALAAGEPRQLLDLDAELAVALGVGGLVAWQVLAGAWETIGSGRPASARVDYAAAPFGVGYVVARWWDPA